jgi:hypothetical protein
MEWNAMRCDSLSSIYVNTLLNVPIFHFIDISTIYSVLCIYVGYRQKMDSGPNSFTTHDATRSFLISPVFLKFHYFVHYRILRSGMQKFESTSKYSVFYH